SWWSPCLMLSTCPSRVLRSIPCRNQGLRLTQEVLRFFLRSPLGECHRFPQPRKSHPGLLPLAQAVLRHGQKRQILGTRALVGPGVELLGAGQSRQGLTVLPGSVLSDAERVEIEAVLRVQAAGGGGQLESPAVLLRRGVGPPHDVPTDVVQTFRAVLRL